MRMYRRLLLVIIIAMSMGIAQTTIAVIDFDGRNISTGEVATLTDRFRDELTKTNQYIVVERGKMEEVLREQGFQQSGCTSDECVVEVGQLIGVQQMVGGSIGKVGNVISVSARIIDVESGEIINVTTYDHSGDIGGLLTEGMRQVVARLISSVSESMVSQLQGFGSLYITSEPSAANIWIDGIQISGTTPAMIDKQNVGEHEILVQKGDYSARQSTTIIKDDFNKLNLVLQLSTGKLKVISDPLEAKVYIDEVEKGLTPIVISDLKAGYHDVSIRFKDYSDSKQSVLIKNNVVEELNITLNKQATVFIKSDPSGAIIIMDGIAKGKTPKSLQLSAGEHTIDLRKLGYYHSNSTIILKPGEKLTRELKLDPWQGSLSVTTIPAGAEVYVNDTKRGVTPLMIDQLRTGDCTVNLKLEDYLSESHQVQVSKDATQTIDANLTSVASIDKEIAGLNKRKLYYLAGSAGAFALAAVLSGVAYNNYNEYQIARFDATELHKTIDQQLLYSKLSLVVGVGCSITAFICHMGQSRLSDKLERSK